MQQVRPRNICRSVLLPLAPTGDEERVYLTQFFSIYSKAPDDEANKMVERWQKDVDHGILIFVSPRISILVFLRIE
jgi:hypothetical protein